ncbi:MAG: hypothetical protein MO852_07595 [Candidatus Devosia euplotis]|nr:hypothetical protein [Candidatus Devosia euplotis]
MAGGVCAIDDTPDAAPEVLDDGLFNGKEQGGGEVMWLRNSTLVRSVMPAITALVNWASEVSGSGMLATTISAPVRRAT